MKQCSSILTQASTPASGRSFTHMPHARALADARRYKLFVGIHTYTHVHTHTHIVIYSYMHVHVHTHSRPQTRRQHQLPSVVGPEKRGRDCKSLSREIDVELNCNSPGFRAVAELFVSFLQFQPSVLACRICCQVGSFTQICEAMGRFTGGRCWCWCWPRRACNW